jgi:hypothetical protein
MFQDTRPAELGPDGGPDAWAGFRVTDGAERLRLLRQLRDGSVPVMLSAPQGTPQLPAVVADAPQGRSASADATAAHATAGVLQRSRGRGLPRQREAAFDRRLVLVHGANASALRAGIPDVIYRFQRRGSYRVRTFERHAPRARLRHPSMPDPRCGLRGHD